MALLALQSVSVAGLNPTFSAPTTSDTVTATGNPMWYHLKITGGAAGTITIVDGGKTPGGSSAAASPITLPASGDRVFSVPAAFASPTTGLVTISLSSTTGITSALMGV